MTGASLCGGYVLLGATWLIIRTDDKLQEKSIGWARWGLLWIALGVALISVGTPLVSEIVRAKWFVFPRIAYLSLLPLTPIASWLWVWSALRRSELQPFLGAVAIFTVSFAGLAYSLYPYIVIDRLTIWQAAHPSSLVFMLIGTPILLPLILAYTAWSYRNFRGKASATESYGN